MYNTADFWIVLNSTEWMPCLLLVESLWRYFVNSCLSMLWIFKKIPLDRWLWQENALSRLLGPATTGVTIDDTQLRHLYFVLPDHSSDLCTEWFFPLNYSPSAAQLMVTDTLVQPEPLLILGLRYPDPPLCWERDAQEDTGCATWAFVPLTGFLAAKKNVTGNQISKACASLLPDKHTIAYNYLA